MKRVLVVAAALWIGRWALRELASFAGRFWLPPGPPPSRSPRQPGRMPGRYD